jgi:hypothetical protein
MKSASVKKSVYAWRAAGVFLTALAAAITGCDKPQKVEARQGDGDTISAAERPFYDAAKPFAEAIAGGDYSKAYGFLSSHAKARMSPNQFVAPTDDATALRNEKAAVQNVSAEKFAQMLTATEKAYGKPSKMLNLAVFSTDPAALSGKAQSGLDKLDSMFAIGMMPASIPADIRKASVRGKVKVDLSPVQLADAAKEQQTTPDKLKSDPDFQPYFTIKIVLVQESGALKVGYFELLPPGIMD